MRKVALILVALTILPTLPTIALAEKKTSTQNQIQACRSTSRLCEEGCGEYYPNPIGEFQRGKNARRQLCVERCNQEKLACYDKVKAKTPSRDRPDVNDLPVLEQ